MKTAVRQTSIDAYYSINLSDEQRMVIRALRMLGGVTCRTDLAAYLNWQTATVSGRVNELIQKGVIFVPEGETIVSHTSGKTVEKIILANIKKEPVKETLF